MTPHSNALAFQSLAVSFFTGIPTDKPHILDTQQKLANGLFVGCLLSSTCSCQRRSEAAVALRLDPSSHQSSRTIGIASKPSQMSQNIFGEFVFSAISSLPCILRKRKETKTKNSFSCSRAVSYTHLTLPTKA